MGRGRLTSTILVIGATGKTGRHVVGGLLEPGRAGRTFELTGSEALTHRRQVAAIGAELAEAMGAEFADRALAHWATLVDDPKEVRDGIEELLGRPARPFSEWARAHADDFAPRGSAG